MPPLNVSNEAALVVQTFPASSLRIKMAPSPSTTHTDTNEPHFYWEWMSDEKWMSIMPTIRSYIEDHTIYFMQVPRSAYGLATPWPISRPFHLFLRKVLSYQSTRGPPATEGLPSHQSLQKRSGLLLQLDRMLPILKAVEPSG